MMRKDGEEGMGWGRRRDGMGWGGMRGDREEGIGRRGWDGMG